MAFPALHISQTILRRLEDVAAYAGDPANLPSWAAGLSSGIRNDGGRWIADSPMGEVEVRFVGPTDLGILDHDVVLPGGAVAHNPLRVLRNGDASEIVFTLFRMPDATDEEFERDAAAVRADLARLRSALEG